MVTASSIARVRRNIAADITSIRGRSDGLALLAAKFCWVSRHPCSASFATISKNGSEVRGRCCLRPMARALVSPRMRLGILGPAHGELAALARAAQHLLDVAKADRVLYLSDDDALDLVVASWARELVGADPSEKV